MSHQSLAGFGVLSAVIVAGSVAGLPLAAQSRSTAAAPAKKAWAPPRTPDGAPDLQGMWTNATITPFERPRALADKPFLTEAEAAALERQSAERREENDSHPRPGDVGSYNEVWFDAGTKVVGTRRTSLVTDPPDGRVPLKPEAEAARDRNLTSEESYELMSPWDRCITRGPGRMFPAGYNNAYQIVQTPGFVTIVHEMIHEARIIPVDGRPHLDPSIRSWTGDSRGRWDGNTLVVETTNFNDKGWIATNAASARIRGVPHSDALKLVERFTRVDAETIEYRFTAEDPSTWTRPFTGMFPMKRTNGPIYEYACHEGNERSMVGMLRGARAQEKF
jgi:hypothetical protein